MKIALSSRLIGKGSIFLVANILNAAIPFLLLPILTRVLSPADYGIVAMFSTFLSFTNTFVGLSVHGAINVQYFKLNAARFSEYVSNCLLLLVASAVVTFLVVLSTGRLIEDLLGIPHKWMLVAVAASFFQFLVTIRLAIWMVTGSAVEYGALQISQTFINCGLSLFFIFLVGLTWDGRLLGLVISIGVFGVASLYLLFRSGYIVRPTNTKADIQNALRFGIPLIPHAVGAFIIYNSDRVMISKLVDVAAVGVYTVGLQLGQAMALLSESFNKVYSPWMMENLAKENIDKIKLVQKSYFAMFSFLFIGALWGIVAIAILPILVGKEFASAKSVIIYMCLGHSFTALYYIVTNYIFFSEKTKILALITFLSALVSIPLTYFLILKFGIEGAALAFLIVQIVFFVLTWILANKVYPMPWLYFLRKNDAK